jgi:putative ABC transport system permease protein
VVKGWLRRWRRNPLLAAHHFITVSLGMAAVTAVASVMYALAFQPLPLRNSPQVVQVWHQAESGAVGALSGADLTEIQEGTRDIFAELGGFTSIYWFLHDQREDAEQVLVSRLERAAFRILDMRPIVGRPVGDSEPPIDSLGPVWISSRLWQARYGARPSVVGETIRLTSRGGTEVRTEIAGVVPSDLPFSQPGVDGAVDVWAVLPDQLKLRAARSRVFFALGRLNVDRTVAEAQAALTVIADGRARAADRRNRPVVQGIEEITQGPARRTFGIWTIGVILVLFLAFVNLASLMVTEASRRRLELSVRASLGASRFRLWREIAAEQSVLTLCALGFGLPLAWITLQVLARLVPFMDVGPPLTRLPSLNASAMLGFCACSLATSLAWSALIVWRAGPLASDALLLSTYTVGAMGIPHTDRRRAVWRLGALSVQAGLGIGLMVLAVSLTRTYVRLTDVNLGPAPDKTVVFSVKPAQTGVLSVAQAHDFNAGALSLLRGLPAVEAIAFADNFPPLGLPVSFWKDDDLTGSPRETTTPLRVSNDYFATLGIPILSGRGFSDSDRHDTKPVAMIDLEMARRNWGSPEATVNAQIKLGASMQQYEVIGVVGSFSGYWAQTPIPTVYFSQNQDPSAGGEVVIRAGSSASVIAERARQVLNGMPVRPIVSSAATLQASWQATTTRPRVRMIGVVLLALMGLALAAQGVYALVTSIIAARTQELAIRAALGASDRAIVWLVLGQVFVAVALGSLAGTIAIVVVRRVAPHSISAALSDPAASIALATALLLSTALLAAYIPARAAARATSVAALLRF